MIQVIGGEVVQHKLPSTGVLKDGCTVSGYNLLPLKILKSEGWLPLEDIKPYYNKESYYLIDDGYEVLKTKVKKKYKILKREEEVKQIDVSEQVSAVAFAVKQLVDIDDVGLNGLEKIINLYEPYIPNNHRYLKGDEFQYNDKLYRVVQEHVTVDYYKPDGVGMESLYFPIQSENVIEEWEQRYGYNPYVLGDMVKWNGKVYKCVKETTYSPTEYAKAWEEVIK